MEMWFTEKHSPHLGLTVKVSQTLHHEVSDYQVLDIVDTPEFGKVMLLDGVIMVTDKDEFVYHEMLSHPALFSHPNPEKVLIIGGGDGGTLREVCRHKSVKKAVLCEIDEIVINASKKYFPEIATGFNDLKAEVIVGDGIKYIQESNELFDVILIDSTDPVGPAEGLFQRDFYEMCYSRLADDGILALQCESPYIRELQPVIKNVYKNLSEIFTIVKPYLAAIHTYQAGLWSFMFASKRYSPDLHFQSKKYFDYQAKLKYYNDEIHKACFALPNFMKDFLK